jgi:hypothetical protein
LDRRFFRSSINLLSSKLRTRRIKRHKKAHKQVVGLEVFSDVTGSIFGGGGRIRSTCVFQKFYSAF